MSKDLTALAEALERAAQLLGYCPLCIVLETHVDCSDKKAQLQLLAHARAVREGRVHINKE